MPHILKNTHIELHFDLPNENYNLPRFDWTGKIVNLLFKGKSMLGVETLNFEQGGNFCGKGLYNEFGIESAFGYDEISEGAYFHKIGVGLLKKDNQPYSFSKNYEIIPADFSVDASSHNIQLTCQGPLTNGYAYLLEKEITLLENGFEIRYRLENKGEKTIITNEYNHNFLCINNHLMNSEYKLAFPFQIKPEEFGEYVNPGDRVDIGKNTISFVATPQEPFFFSKIAGNNPVEAKWSLQNHKNKLAISETGDFTTKQINLWGDAHVISPELFFDIHLEPEQTANWTRTYYVWDI